MNLTQDVAEAIALKGLIWLVANEELLPVFMGSTGVGEDDIRENAGDPEFLGSVLDFILMNDEWIMAFCTVEGLDFEMPLAARGALPGGANMHWT